jgi:pimeloyl-ACP methyl ester carboxylesterase
MPPVLTPIGSGPTLVCFHGFCENKEIWEPLLPFLAARYRVVCADAPGFGKHDYRLEGQSMTQLADLLADWLHPLAPFVYLGHSMGGYLGLALAAKAPQLFAGLCLLHSTAAPDSVEKKESRTKTMEFIDRNGKEAFLHGFVPNLFYRKSDEAIHTVTQMGLATETKSIIEMTRIMRDRPDYTDLLKEMPFPVKWIAGKEDAIIPVDSLPAQVVLAADGQLHVLHKVGHMGMFEAPKQTTYSFLSFAEYCFDCAQLDN